MTLKVLLTLAWLWIPLGYLIFNLENTALTFLNLVIKIGPIFVGVCCLFWFWFLCWKRDPGPHTVLKVGVLPLAHILALRVLL